MISAWKEQRKDYMTKRIKASVNAEDLAGTDRDKAAIETVDSSIKFHPAPDLTEDQWDELVLLEGEQAGIEYVPREEFEHLLLAIHAFNKRSPQHIDISGL